MADPEGAEGAYAPPKIALRLGNLQKLKYISGTTHRTKMADHFLKTPEYEKCKNVCLVCLKVTESAAHIEIRGKLILRTFS